MHTGPVDIQALADRLKQQASIDDPYTGKASPGEMQARSKLWPDPTRWQQIDLKWVIEQGSRRIEEYVFTGVPGNALTKMGMDLPVAIVFEKAAGTSHARVYSAHELVADRAPMLQVDENLIPHRGEHDILFDYFEILHSANVEATVDIFEAEGYMRHSNGEAHRGSVALRAAFTKFYQNGGIHLRYCNKTDDGAITALECYMPSGRPACAVYHRSDDGKKIHAARLYL